MDSLQYRPQMDHTQYPENGRWQLRCHAPFSFFIMLHLWLVLEAAHGLCAAYARLVHNIRMKFCDFCGPYFFSIFLLKLSKIQKYARNFGPGPAPKFPNPDPKITKYEKSRILHIKPQDRKIKPRDRFQNYDQIFLLHPVSMTSHMVATIKSYVQNTFFSS